MTQRTWRFWGGTPISIKVGSFPLFEPWLFSPPLWRQSESLSWPQDPGVEQHESQRSDGDIGYIHLTAIPGTRCNAKSLNYICGESPFVCAYASVRGFRTVILIQVHWGRHELLVDGLVRESLVMITYFFLSTLGLTLLTEGFVLYASMKWVMLKPS